MRGMRRRRGRRARRQERRRERNEARTATAEPAAAGDADAAPGQPGGMPFAMPPAVEQMLRKRAEQSAESAGPETFLHGAVNGTGMIVGSALAGVAVVTTLPLMGLAKGGIGGLVAGSVAGGLAGALIPVAGVLAGTGQIVSGVFNTPKTVGAFVKDATAPESEFERLEEPDDEAKHDEEDVADARAEIEASLEGADDGHAWPDEVRETGLYDQLAAAPSSAPGALRRAYLGAYREAAADAERLQAVSSAYQALRDPARRKAYNEQGAKDALKDFVALEHAAYHAMVCGEAAFAPYVGVLAAGQPGATAADRADAQRRREADVAEALRERITPYVTGRHEDFCKAQLAAAEELRGTRYGRQMLTLLGHTYKSKALLVMGHRGVLSWISGGWHDAHEAVGDAKDCAEAVKAAAEVAELKRRAEGGHSLDARDHARVQLQERTINAAWTVTVLDVETTVRAAVSAVLDKPRLKADEFQARARAILLLGKIFLFAGGEHYSSEEAARQAKSG